MAVKISRGDFYYHFKPKDEILDAVIQKRLADRKVLLSSWNETNQNPARRIECFIKIVIVNQSRIMNYGCSVGTLTTELVRASGDNFEPFDGGKQFIRPGAS